MKRIFVFAYYSFKDPVFQSATLSYLERANKTGNNFEFKLLTFEHPKFTYRINEIDAIENELKSLNIQWHRSQWRTGGFFKPILKIIDLLIGIRKGYRIVKSHQCDLIYSEGVVGASIAHFISILSQKPHVVHSFEPHADSMLEGGVWSKRSWEYLFLKKFEKIVGRRAWVLITGTQAYKDKIKEWREKENIYVIPSCVDENHFRFHQDSRDDLRGRNGISCSTIVLVYLGKFGGMYMEDELFQFFKNCEEESSMDFHYWIFSGDDNSWITRKFDDFGIPLHKRLVKKLDKNEVPNYLSAADIGIVAVRPFPSKRYCSPIKTGEYWSCGLPVIVPEGVGDDYQIVKDNPSLGICTESIESYYVHSSLGRVNSKHLVESRTLTKYLSKWIAILNGHVS